MALREGSSEEVIQDNIRCILEKDGCGYDPPYLDPSRKEYTPAQAAAIAYAKAGKRKSKKESSAEAGDKGKKGTTESAEKGSDDPCWKDYEMVGTKKGRGGKQVPNCVRKSSDHSELVVPDGWSVSPNA